MNLPQGQTVNNADGTDYGKKKRQMLVRDTHLLLPNAGFNRTDNAGQWYFLRALWDEEGLSQRELSRRVGTTEPTTVSALRLLSRSGMIERIRNPKDRRTINIFLTEKARNMKCELMPVAIEVNDIATSGLSASEFIQLRELLQIVRDNLDTDED